MFTDILYFLPSVVTLLWFFTFVFKVKSARQKVFMWILGLGTFYFATYAAYVHPQGDYLTLVKMDAMNVPVIFMLISFIVLYMWMHLRPGKVSVAWQALMLTPAAVLGAIVAMLYYLVGFEQAASLVEHFDKGLPRPVELDTPLTDLYVFFDATLPDYFSMLFLVIIVGLSAKVMKEHGYRFGDVCRFFFKGQASKPSRVIAFLQIFFFLSFLPMVFLDREYLNAHPAFGASTTVMFAILMHMIAYVEFFGDEGSLVTLHDLSHVVPMNEASLDEVEAAEPTDDSSKASQTARNEQLMAKVVALFEQEEVYRRDDLTLDVLSQMAGIGRTTLSTFINLHYGASFRDVVNRYRVDAVKQYLLSNPNATQEAAADYCGFKDASSLNRKFRELENETPLMWLIHHKK